MFLGLVFETRQIGFDVDSRWFRIRSGAPGGMFLICSIDGQIFLLVDVVGSTSSFKSHLTLGYASFADTDPEVRLREWQRNFRDQV